MLTPSTLVGGIIGLAVALSAKSPDDMISFFEDTCKSTFGRSNEHAGGLLPKYGAYALMLMKVHKSRFKTEPLKNALETFFGRKAKLYAPEKALSSSATRVAVTAVRDGLTTSCLIGNYNHRSGFDRNTCDIEREEDERRGFSASEAGLATSAAPAYLEPFFKRETGTDYADGAMYANCPARLAFEQMRKIWARDCGSTTEAMLDILISIGTGNQPAKSTSSKGDSLVRKTFDADFVKAIERLIENHTESERMWVEFETSICHTAPTLATRLHRLNPRLDEGKRVELFDWKKLEGLKKETNRWIKDNDTLLQCVANRLLGGLFFFEPTTAGEPPLRAEEDRKRVMQGKILCRLSHHDAEMGTLLSRCVKSFWYTEHNLADNDHGSSLAHIPRHNWQPMLAPGQGPKDMLRFYEDENVSKFEIPHTIVVDKGQGQWVVLAVKVQGSEEFYPLSGFPATFDELKVRSKMTWL